MKNSNKYAIIEEALEREFIYIKTKVVLMKGGNLMKITKTIMIAIMAIVIFTFAPKASAAENPEEGYVRVENTRYFFKFDNEEVIKFEKTEEVSGYIVNFDNENLLSFNIEKFEKLVRIVAQIESVGFDSSLDLYPDGKITIMDLSRATKWVANNPAFKIGVTPNEVKALIYSVMSEKSFYIVHKSDSWQVVTSIEEENTTFEEITTTIEETTSSEETTTTLEETTATSEETTTTSEETTTEPIETTSEELPEIPPIILGQFKYNGIFYQWFGNEPFENFETLERVIIKTTEENDETKELLDLSEEYGLIPYFPKKEFVSKGKIREYKLKNPWTLYASEYNVVKDIVYNGKTAYDVYIQRYDYTQNGELDEADLEFMRSYMSQVPTLDMVGVTVRDFFLLLRISQKENPSVISIGTYETVPDKGKVFTMLTAEIANKYTSGVTMPAEVIKTDEGGNVTIKFSQKEITISKEKIGTLFMVVY